MGPYRLNSHLIKEALMAIEKHIIRKDSSWIKSQMPYGGCSLFGQLKLTLEWYICPMITLIQSLVEINEIMSG